jgi:hypothetical protein
VSPSLLHPTLHALYGIICTHISLTTDTNVLSAGLSILCVVALLVRACALLTASCLSLHPILIEEADRVATPEVS